jgi:L-ascorbate metabolism protein UlaG (beta-lactamase superfamily)
MGSQHMKPEESLRALRDLNATHFVGMHWAAYDLSDEPIDAGARWLEAAAAERQLPREQVHVLAPGGSLALTGARGATRARVRHRWLSAER